MRIDRIVLYGFGRHEQLDIVLQPGMNILYGPNEAGKTTIQQGVLHILFGFPAKNQSLLRYEPKTGGKYGGRLHLTDETYGAVIVERVRGKSAGDVTVYLQDGQIAGEEFLQQLLRRYDRAAFEAIFSFSLLQLQGLDQLDEDELSRTLLASGTTGIDTLLQVEKRMDKELGELFKKSGRIPVMNKMITELQEMERDLQKERERLAQYTPAAERLEELESALDQLREEDDSLRDEDERFASALQVLPLLEKERQLTDRIAQLAVSEFPPDGLRRYETLAGKQLELNAAKNRLNEERAHWTEETSNVLEEEKMERLERLVAEEAEWHRWKVDASAASSELAALQSRKRQLESRLGISEDAPVDQLNVSLDEEERWRQAFLQQATYEGEMESLHRQLADLEQDRFELEAAAEQLRNNALSEEQQSALEKLPALKQKLAEKKAAVALASRQASSTNRLPLLLVVIGLFLGAYGVIQQEWILAISGGIVIAAGIFFGKQQPGNSLEEDREFIKQYEPQIAELERLMEQVQVERLEERRLTDEINRTDRKQQMFAEELDELYAAKKRVDASIEILQSKYPAQLQPARSTVTEWFRMIRELQEVGHQLQMWEQRAVESERNMKERMQEAEQLLGRPLTVDTLTEQLRRVLLDQTEQQERRLRRNEAMSRLKQAEQELNGQLASIQEQIAELFRLAGVETEEQYYAAYETYQELLLLRRQLDDVEAQLRLYPAIDSSERWTLPELQQKRAAIADKRRACAHQIQQLSEEKASVSLQLETLQSDYTYSERLQMFEVKKAEFAGLAGQWAARQAVAEAIRQTMRNWKEHQLPEVLNTAEQLFKRLTGGRYESLHIGEDGRFRAVTNDTQMFTIGELSQGTKEQAYTALRLALANSLAGKAPFPILMDDPFVHFDGKRFSSMMKILNDLQSSHQFLYFTCHEDVQTRWANECHSNVVAVGRT